MYQQLLDEFEVTRIHGLNALNSLSEAHRLWEEQKKWKEKEESQTQEEWFQTANVAGSHVSGLEMQIFSRLSKTVVLYQASMEAILANAAAQDDSVAAVATGTGFKSDWRAALEAVDQPTTEFDAYERDFYQEMRIPLTHLHPNSENRLTKIKAIDFERVYNGVRYGWWAHTRLLRGADSTAPQIQENWEKICRGVDLPPDLFPSSHPSQLDG